MAGGNKGNKRMNIREITSTDSSFISAACTRAFASPYVVAAGQKRHVPDLSGLIAWEGGVPMAHVTWHIADKGMEIVTLVAEVPGKGYAKALMLAARAEAERQGLTRLHLETTNDNTHALRFYQKLGLRLCELRAGAVDQARKSKPEIPLTGQDGIPLRDELVLEWILKD